MDNIKKSLKLTFIAMLIFGIVYPFTILLLGQSNPEKSEGSPVFINGKIRGFENIGQKFSEDKYFHGRPSAVGYNAASTGGSNKAPTNSGYLEEVNSRIDAFLKQNNNIAKTEIPSELVTSSGSGIDPHVSPEAAFVQIPRIAVVRNMDENILTKLVRECIETKYFGLFGIEVINVFKLNYALDNLKKD